MTKNELVPEGFIPENIPVVRDFVSDLTSESVSFCSMKANDNKSKAMLFKAMNNPEKRIGDCINTLIKVKDVYCETVQVVSNETGETEWVPRVVLIDEKGTAYQAVSMGVYSALAKVIRVFGMPTWNEPIPIKIKQISRGERKLLTFDVEY